MTFLPLAAWAKRPALLCDATLASGQGDLVHILQSLGIIVTPVTPAAHRQGPMAAGPERLALN